MFIPYRVDITKLVSPTDLNQLRIDFKAAQKLGRAIRDADKSHRYVNTLGSNERLAVRKAQYHWGWDWGPKFLTVGPWRPVRLETYKSRLEDVNVQYTLDSERKTCGVTVSANVQGTRDAYVKVILRDPRGVTVHETSSDLGNSGAELSSDIFHAEDKFLVNKPLLWYPHGYGEQHQYHLDVILISKNSSEALHSENYKIGFRQTELVQEKDKFGTSFYFRINGVDIFAGGACWIPADSFIPRLTREKYRDWLKIMTEGNQIMIRYALLLLPIFYVGS